MMINIWRDILSHHGLFILYFMNGLSFSLKKTNPHANPSFDPHLIRSEREIQGKAWISNQIKSKANTYPVFEFDKSAAKHMICSLFLLTINLNFVSESLEMYHLCIRAKKQIIFYNSVGIDNSLCYTEVRRNRSPFCWELIGSHIQHDDRCASVKPAAHCTIYSSTLR